MEMYSIHSNAGSCLIRLGVVLDAELDAVRRDGHVNAGRQVERLEEVEDDARVVDLRRHVAGNRSR